MTEKMENVRCPVGIVQARKFVAEAAKALLLAHAELEHRKAAVKQAQADYDQTVGTPLDLIDEETQPNLFNSANTPGGPPS